MFASAFSPLSMKTIYPVVPFPEYARFLNDFLFTGLPLPVVRVCLPRGQWPSEEIDLRPLVVARCKDSDDNPMNSVVQFDNEILDSCCSSWAVWRTVLLSGQICAISFRAAGWHAFLTFTISKELGELWQEHGYPAVAHECPEMDILSTDYAGVSSCFKSEAWGDDVVVRAPKPVWRKMIEQGGYWDDQEHYSTL
ncbi:hypothetical protein P171DRAFT_73386 [Karstenula rhodostoma CBS 690.94]|uniref:Uncharacterized protein n=1 Tax=Karstenula rhodostoma CBS 690.94 TaxID=1392251 RepID=A0A9P4U9X5_9PLEO|nr:hypothetical protein P171DRAFT_73386 [Karstenula rhodostoma CBS 690.94]